MGLFSRKDKASKANSSLSKSHSTASVNSGASRGIGNRTSAGSITPATPLSPMSPVKLPKVDLPRPPDPQLDPTGYLRSLGAVRERSKIIFDRATRDELNHFDVDLNKLPDVVTWVTGLIKVRPARLPLPLALRGSPMGPPQPPWSWVAGGGTRAIAGLLTTG